MSSELPRVFVTGADGFVGSALVHTLSLNNYFVTGATRSKTPDKKSNYDKVPVGNIDGQTDWSSCLQDQDVVIHTAAKTYGQKNITDQQLTELREVNVRGTLNLARQAASKGIKRFIFISSIKVNGEQTKEGAPFSETDQPNPSDAYGVSKLDAEVGLVRLSQETDMEVVIIRPPVVYGPGAKGNFSKLIQLIHKGRPLPLGAVNNKRSLVSIYNLTDLIVTCIDHPNAGNHVFLVSDGEDLSTTELVKSLANAAGKKIRLLYVPSSLMKVSAICIGKSAYAIRLLGSLQIDLSKTNSVLGWAPPVSTNEGLRRCFS